jgi:hypothetical protein
VGVLRAWHCHLRAGFQQCKSFVEMGTVRCCPLCHPTHCPMKVPRVMVRRTASPVHADFGRLSEILFHNGELNLLQPDCGCQLQLGTGHVTSLLFADDRTSVLPPSNCRVCGTWCEGHCGWAVSSVGVLRSLSCHLRAGFQQFKSFVEMGTVRCCLL